MTPGRRLRPTLWPREGDKAAAPPSVSPVRGKRPDSSNTALSRAARPNRFVIIGSTGALARRTNYVLQSVSKPNPHRLFHLSYQKLVGAGSAGCLCATVSWKVDTCCAVRNGGRTKARIQTCLFIAQLPQARLFSETSYCWLLQLLPAQAFDGIEAGGAGGGHGAEHYSDER